MMKQGLAPAHYLLKDRHPLSVIPSPVSETGPLFMALSNRVCPWHTSRRAEAYTVCVLMRLDSVPQYHVSEMHTGMGHTGMG